MNRVIGLIAASAAVTVQLVTLGCVSWGHSQNDPAAIAPVDAGGGLRQEPGSSARRALLGAALGGTAGGLIDEQMDRHAQALSRQLEGGQVSRVGGGIVVIFDSATLFHYDSAALTSEARSELRTLADSLQVEWRTQAMVLGHTDSEGDDAENLLLSERRARSAEDYLVFFGVASSRIVSVGRGGTEPIASNETELGRLHNRRVEVAIYPSEAWRHEATRTSGLR